MTILKELQMVASSPVHSKGCCASWQIYKNPKPKALLLAFAAIATDWIDINKVIDDGEGDHIKQ